MWAIGSGAICLPLLTRAMRLSDSWSVYVPQQSTSATSSECRKVSTRQASLAFAIGRTKHYTKAREPRRGRVSLSHNERPLGCEVKRHTEGVWHLTEYTLAILAVVAAICHVAVAVATLWIVVVFSRACVCAHTLSNTHSERMLSQMYHLTAAIYKMLEKTANGTIKRE
jgi:hypothetical protein